MPNREHDECQTSKACRIVIFGFFFPRKRFSSGSRAYLLVLAYSYCAPFAFATTKRLTGEAVTSEVVDCNDLNTSTITLALSILLLALLRVASRAAALRGTSSYGVLLALLAWHLTVPSSRHSDSPGNFGPATHTYSQAASLASMPIPKWLAMSILY